ncbi:MAG: protein DpdG [Gemmataceae bacterium]
MALGLFDRGGDDVVRLDPNLPADVLKRDTGEAALRRTLRELVMRSNNNDPFWGSKGVPASDFTRGLAWCLAMDPLRLHGNGYDPVNRLELDTLPADVEVFRNDTRWNGFKAWSVFLGFGWLARYPKAGTLVVDPAPAIREALPAVFGGAARLTQKDFVERLREQLPVLDGGRYRRAVEEKLVRGLWPEPKSGEASPSLSLALHRLRAEGVLEFENLADPAAGRLVLVGRSGRQLAQVTHVRFKGVTP